MWQWGTCVVGEKRRQDKRVRRKEMISIKKRKKERNGYIRVWWGKNGEGKQKKKNGVGKKNNCFYLFVGWKV